MVTELPKSASSLAINLAGVLGYIVALVAIYYCYPDIDFGSFFLISAGSIIVTIIALEIWIIKPHKNESIGWLATPEPANNERVRLKTFGVMGTFAGLAILYAILPEYNKEYYTAYKSLFFLGMLISVGGGFIYVDYMDRRVSFKKDGFWQVGCVLKGRWREVDKTILIEHIKQWIIKGFFLPVMINGFGSYCIQLAQGNIFYHNFFLEPKNTEAPFFLFMHLDFSTFGWNDYLLLAIFFVVSIDVLFAAVGYIMTFRILNSHIKSTDPTVIGWLVCILCYPPFWTALFVSFFAYNEGPDWRMWLKDNPTLFFYWGMLVLITNTINSLCTITIGIRFSNLTYRGLVTSGFYRFSKHPQYIAKWVNWLLVGVPFVPYFGVWGAINSTILLGLIGVVYYMRARTEENHLSNYPEYVAYAKWVDEHGIFRKIAKVIPYLRYSEERAIRAGSIIWQKKTPQANLSLPI